jgi:hypothetical protein
MTGRTQAIIDFFNVCNAWYLNIIFAIGFVVFLIICFIVLYIVLSGNLFRFFRMVKKTFEGDGTGGILDDDAYQIIDKQKNKGEDKE